MRVQHLAIKATFLTPLQLTLGYILGKQSLSEGETLIFIGSALLMGVGAGLYVVKSLAEIEAEINARKREGGESDG